MAKWQTLPAIHMHNPEWIYHISLCPRIKSFDNHNNNNNGHRLSHQIGIIFGHCLEASLFFCFGPKNCNQRLRIRLYELSNDYISTEKETPKKWNPFEKWRLCVCAVKRGTALCFSLLTIFRIYFRANHKQRRSSFIFWIYWIYLLHRK